MKKTSRLFRGAVAVLTVAILALAIAYAATPGRVNIAGVIHSVSTTGTTGAVALTLGESESVEVTEIRLTLDAAGGAGDLTVTLDSGQGAAFDNGMLTQDMTSAASVHWIPTRPIILDKADGLVCAFPNAGNKTYGCEILFRKL